MILKDWQKSRYLTRHTTSRQEIRDRFRKKRNISMYERSGTISEQEADEAVDVAVKLQGMIETWLQKNHPELL